MTVNGNLSQKALYKVRIWTTLSRHLPNSGNQDQSLIYRSLWSFRWTYDWLKNRSASKNVRRSQIYRINRFWQSNFAFWNEKLSEASSTFLIERMLLMLAAAALSLLSVWSRAAAKNGKQGGSGKPLRFSGTFYCWEL